MAGGLWLVVYSWWLAAASLISPDPMGPIKPEFTDLSVGVLITTATGGSMVKDPAAFDNLFVRPWRVYLDTNNAVLQISDPLASWDGPKPPASVRWECAAQIRQAWNETDAEVKTKLIDAFKQYHQTVWSGGEGKPRNVPCTIIGMGTPLTDPGEAFSDVVVTRIPEEGPTVEFQIRLIYD